MRQSLGAKKKKIIVEILGEPIEYATVRGGEPHGTAMVGLSGSRLARVDYVNKKIVWGPLTQEEYQASAQ